MLQPSAPRYEKRPRTDWLIVHCSLSTGDWTIADQRQADLARGMVDIGCHFFIRQDGTLEVGRPHNTIGSHQWGLNHSSLGVTLDGGASHKPLEVENNFTQAQLDTLEKVILQMEALYPSFAVVGHNRLEPSHPCPVFDVAHWLEHDSGIGRYRNTDIGIQQED